MFLAGPIVPTELMVAPPKPRDAPRIHVEATFEHTAVDRDPQVLIETRRHRKCNASRDNEPSRLTAHGSVDIAKQLGLSRRIRTDDHSEAV
jgi:hypothetical protein